MPRKTDLEAPPPTDAPADVPGPLGPQNVPADVEIKTRFRRNVNPEQYAEAPAPARASAIFDDELNRLALEEDQHLAPPSTFADFLESFSEYNGRAECQVVRLPDPVDKRIPGSRYARTNFTETEVLGPVPFDIATLLPSIQMLNGDSGGVFRIFLVDHEGRMIPGARLERLALPDPLGAHRHDQATQPQQQPSQPHVEFREREPSEAERLIQSLQTRMMQTALERAINPPVPAPASPLSTLSPDDQLAMLLLTKTDVLGSAIERISAVVSAGETSAAPSTWQDKIMEVVTHNPTIVDRVGSIADRLLARIFGPDARFDNMASFTPAPVQPVRAPAQPVRAAQPTNLPDEAPDTTRDDPGFDDDDAQDMKLLQDVITYLTGTDPIVRDHPIFKHLREAYPARFPFYVNMIADAPSVDVLIFGITQAYPLFDALMHSSLAPHYHNRLGELKTLCEAEVARKRGTAPAAAPAYQSQTESTRDPDFDPAATPATDDQPTGA